MCVHFLIEIVQVQNLPESLCFRAQIYSSTANIVCVCSWVTFTTQCIEVRIFDTSFPDKVWHFHINVTPYIHRCCEDILKKQVFYQETLMNYSISRSMLYLHIYEA